MAYRGFELVNLDYTKVSPPTSIASFVNGITAEGDLVGYAEIHNSYSNFAFRQGKFGPITIPAATAPFVLGTNPAGTAVVGYYQVFSGIVGFVYQNRILQTLSFPGSITTIATGINANGDVVGYFIDNSDVTHGFLWTASAAMPKQPSPGKPSKTISPHFNIGPRFVVFGTETSSHNGITDVEYRGDHKGNGTAQPVRF